MSLPKIMLVFLFFGVLIGGYLFWNEPSKRSPKNKKSPQKNNFLKQKISSKISFWLAFTGEEQGYLEPCGCSEGLMGGMMRRHALFQYLGNPKSQVFPISMGNSMANFSRLSQIKMDFLVQGLNQMKTKAYALGKQDFVFLPWFQKNQKARFPLLCANLSSKETNILPYQIIRFSKKKQVFSLALIGLIAPSLRQIFTPPKKITIQKISKVLPSILQNLQGKVQQIVVLFHGSLKEARQILKDYPFVNVVVVANNSSKVRIQKIKAQTLILTAKKGQSVVLLGWMLPKKRVAKVKVIPLNDQIPDSISMTKIYERYVLRVRSSGLSLRFSNQKPTTGGTFVGSSRCFSCHPFATKKWKASKHSFGFSSLQKKGQHKNPECLSCHTVGYRYVTGFVSATLTNHLKNIGCESCHGPGSNHLKRPELGFGKIGSKNCIQCHTKENSPRFDFLKYYSRIEHLKKSKN